MAEKSITEMKAVAWLKNKQILYDRRGPENACLMEFLMVPTHFSWIFFGELMLCYMQLNEQLPKQEKGHQLCLTLQNKLFTYSNDQQVDSYMLRHLKPASPAISKHFYDPRSKMHLY